MIKLNLKSNIDLRQAETVTVVFYKDDKELLTKAGEDLTIKQSRVELYLSADELALWEPGRYIGIDVNAVYANGDELESNYVYRSFDPTKSRTEYWANTYFGDDEPHHSEVVDTSDATLTSGSQMLAPYTAYARGDKITGTMQKYGGEVITIPASIAIVQNPTKMAYENGELIDLTGLIIKGFYENGDAWEGDSTHEDGVIPLDELTAIPESASFPTGDLYEKSGVTAIKVPVDVPLGSRYRNRSALGVFGESPVFYSFLGSNGYGFQPVSQSGNVYLTRYDGKIYGVDGGIGVRQYISVYEDGNTVYGWGTSDGISSNNTFSGYCEETSSDFNLIKDIIPISTVNPYGVDFSNPVKVEKKQNITIKWPRVGDGEELSVVIQISADEE